jgi:hypothetical protein
MSAVIFAFQAPAVRRAGSAQTSGAASTDTMPDYTGEFCFWRGASGERYVHHVYNLRDCPQLPPSNYIFVARDGQGVRKILKVARAIHLSGSLNLADVRHLGAKLGASEVHVHFLGQTEAQRRIIDMDLHSGLFADRTEQSLSA